LCLIKTGGSNLIATLKGLVQSKKPDNVIVDVSGIGYRVSIPLCNLGDIPEPGNPVFLHTYMHVREDSLQLFGFLSDEERKVFSTLLGISGVGPKLGLAILSGMPAQRFIEAIQSEDVSLLSTIPGLGKKTASRLVLELKGKLPSLDADGAHLMQRDSASGDAVSALVNLGYKKPLSEKAVEKAVNNGSDSIEEIIREALKYLTGN
jgi:Holliday junction DNA helicase RuvA